MQAQKGIITEAQRTAKKGYDRNYYLRNAERIKEYSKKRHRELRGFGAETLAEEDKLELKELSYEADWVVEQMKLGGDHISDERKELDDFLINSDMTVQENRDKVVQLAIRCGCTSRCRNGYYFEKVIKKLLLNIFDGTPFKLYTQVPYDNDNVRRSRKIDFVVTEEETDKDKLNLSAAVVVSCKTSFHTSWREDEILYDKCRYYIMVSLKCSIPKSPLPDNVFFCSPSIEDGEHTIDMNSLTQTIMAMLSDHF